jgi:putative transposase
MAYRKAFRFQLRPRSGREGQLRRYAGMCRRVWNDALAEQKARHARGESYAGYLDMASWLSAWRHAPATAWLSAGPVHPQQQVLRRLEEAFGRFFAGESGYPRFKRRGDEPGLRFPDPKQFALDQLNARIKLPKLGWLRLRLSRPVEGALRNVTLRREGAKWFASIQVELSDTVPLLDVPPTLGIDRGLATFAATSDERLVPPLKALAKQQRRLRYLQRAVSRKRKGSANRGKAVRRLGNLHRRVAYQRADWLHKLTTDLTHQQAVIALEDLKIKNMSASAHGTVEVPGKNVRAKAGLNRSILDAAWGEFARQLSYKCAWRGGEVIRVPPAYTSRTCRICHYESAENRKTQSLFRCVRCGHEEHADIHAAKIILAAGHAVWAKRHGASPAAHGEAVRRESIPAASAKWEPAEAKGSA